VWDRWSSTHYRGVVHFRTCHPNPNPNPNHNPKPNPNLTKTLILTLTNPNINSNSTLTLTLRRVTKVRKWTRAHYRTSHVAVLAAVEHTKNEYFQPIFTTN